MSNTLEDFARDEIYAFIRFIAILSTFLLAASFTIYSIHNGSFIGNEDKLFFTISVISGCLNIIAVWIHLFWTLFLFYNKLGKIHTRLTDDKLRTNNLARFGQLFIWFTFFICLAGFSGYLFITVYN